MTSFREPVKELRVGVVGDFEEDYKSGLSTRKLHILHHLCENSNKLES